MCAAAIWPAALTVRKASDFLTNNERIGHSQFPHLFGSLRTRIRENRVPDPSKNREASGTDIQNRIKAEPQLCVIFLPLPCACRKNGPPPQALSSHRRR